MWDRIIDNLISESANKRPKLPGVSNVTDEQLAAEGWYERAYEQPPAGYRVTAYQWAGVIDGRSVYGVTASEPTPEPAPERFEAGIDTPILVLDTPDARGIGYVAAPDGTLVPIIHAHESAYDMAELAAKKQAAIAAYTARMQAAGFMAAEITALRQFRDVDVDTLFSTLTENQRKFLKVVQAATVLQIKERVQEANQ